MSLIETGVIANDWGENASATAAVATATRAADGRRAHILGGVVVSYSAAQGGTLTIRSGNTVILEVAVQDRLVLDNLNIKGGYGEALSAALSAGGAGVIGRVSIYGYSTK